MGVTYTFNPQSQRLRWADFYEFEVNLVCILSFSLSRTADWESFFKNIQTKQPKSKSNKQQKTKVNQTNKQNPTITATNKTKEKTNEATSTKLWWHIEAQFMSYIIPVIWQRTACNITILLPNVTVIYIMSLGLTIIYTSHTRLD